MKISIVLAVLNEEKFMHIALTSLNEQTRPYDELIIVVDERSTDESINIAKTYTNKIFSSSAGKLTALQIGASMSSNDVIVTADADVWYPPDYIERIAKHFENPNVSLVIGVSYHDGLSPFGNSMQNILTIAGYIFLKYGIGHNRAFRREAFMQIGGFNLNIDQFNLIRLSMEEEQAFHRRLASIGQIVYDPSIIVHHISRRSECTRCNEKSEGEICEYCNQIRRGDRF